MLLYAAATLDDLLLFPEKLYYLEGENDLVLDDGGGANVAKPNSESGEMGLGERGGQLYGNANVIVNSDTDPSVTPSTSSASLNQNVANHKTILFYTKFFSSAWTDYLTPREAINKCPISACTFLQDSSDPDDADALIFHYYDFNERPLPTRRRPEQLYVWLNLEAPNWEEEEVISFLRERLKAFGILQQTQHEWQFGPRGYFNWTMTYHRASDVMAPYGALLPLSGE